MGKNNEVGTINTSQFYKGHNERQDTASGMAPPGNRTTGGHSKHRRHRPGPKRKGWMPNPFGKYPLASAVKKYLNATEQYYAPVTQAERRRKLRSITTQMVTLGAPKSPKKWNKDHIRTYIQWMRDRDLDNRTQHKYLTFLKDFLEYYDNTVISKMMKKKEMRMPQSAPKDIQTIPQDVIELIHNSTLTMEGWKGSIARMMTMIYPYSGLRPSELRTLKYKDVDLANWHITVSHPKGENSYGKRRLVGILPQTRETLSVFLEERRLFLQKHGFPEDVEPFIPHLTKKGEITVWPSQKLN